MIYITGDCHGDFRRFNKENSPEQKDMSRDDCVIICGDFGGVWNFDGETKNERYWLDWLEDKNYTTLFVDGNHECHPLLKKYEQKSWNGGMVHEIRPHVLHLMRGEIFDIDGTSFFAFGGANSHDIQDGILDPRDKNFKKRYKELSDRRAMFRVFGVSWWPEEMPTEEEMNNGLINLKKHGNKVDYIVTHEAPASTLQLLYHGRADVDDLNRYLEKIRSEIDYTRWFFGHHHINEQVNDKDICLYEQIVRIA